jgi:uncharacterized membrane protein
VVVLFLSGFGIYLGRFLRWNSWHIVLKPFRLLGEIAERGYNPMEHSLTVGVTVIYGMILVLGYVALRLLQPIQPTPVAEKQLD